MEDNHPCYYCGFQMTPYKKYYCCTNNPSCRYHVPGIRNWKPPRRSFLHKLREITLFPI